MPQIGSSVDTRTSQHINKPTSSRTRNGRNWWQYAPKRGLFPLFSRLTRVATSWKAEIAQPPRGPTVQDKHVQQKKMLIGLKSRPNKCALLSTFLFNQSAKSNIL